MKTREQIRLELESSNPTTQVDEVTYSPGDAVYEALMEQWIDAMLATPPPSLPNAENYQIRAWMIRNDLDPDAVPQMITQLVTDAKERKESLMRWDYAVRVPRNYPLVDAIGSQMGLTPEQIDAAWPSIVAL
jgi:hypothetical protein